MKKILFLPVLILGFSNQISAQISSGFRNTYVPQYVPLPLETFKESNQLEQAQYEQRLANCREELEQLYKDAPNYPEIKDGKHLVNIVGPGTCNEKYVLVQQGKIVSITKSNGDNMTNFTVSTPIKSCLSKVGIADPETGVSNYYHVVFLKDIYGE